MIRTLYWAPASPGETTAFRRTHLQPTQHVSGESAHHAGDNRDLWRAWRANGGLIWIDLTEPADQDIGELIRLFDLHKIAVDIALTPHSRPKLTRFDHFMALTLYAARPLAEVRVPGRQEPPLDQLQEVDLLFGEGFLLTFHDQRIAAVDDAWLLRSRESIPPAGGLADLLHSVIDGVVDQFFPVLDVIVDRVEALQEFAFVGSEGASEKAAQASNAQQLKRLFRDKRELMNLQRTVIPQRNALMALTRLEVPYVDPETAAFQDVFDHAVRIAEHVHIYHELLVGAREALLVRISNNMGAAVKLLLCVTLLLAFPLFVSAVYGMNFAHMPELSWPTGHSLALLLILCGDGLLFYYLRYRLHLWR